MLNHAQVNKTTEQIDKEKKSQGWSIKKDGKRKKSKRSSINSSGTRKKSKRRSS